MEIYIKINSLTFQDQHVLKPSGTSKFIDSNFWGVNIEDKKIDECNCGCEDLKENEKSENIETCYFCLKEFDISKDDSSHYKYGKFPMCAYCSEFYGFYSD